MLFFLSTNTPQIQSGWINYYKLDKMKKTRIKINLYR